MARSVNKVILIGNVVKDPDLRETPNGKSVCSFTLATNRSWKTETGEKHEESEYHLIVAWQQLAVVCHQLLHKGSKIYIQGRLATKQWVSREGLERTKTEIHVDDLVLLDAEVKI